MAKNKSIIRDSRTGRFVVGRNAFGAISAVEGLRMPAAMEKEFRELDRRGASLHLRRDTLTGKYGK